TGPGRPRMSTVAELMSRRVVAASEDAGFKEIAVVLRANGISALPVVAADRRVIGVVSAAHPMRRITVSTTAEAAAPGIPPAQSLPTARRAAPEGLPGMRVAARSGL